MNCMFCNHNLQKIRAKELNIWKPVWLPCKRCRKCNALYWFYYGKLNYITFHTSKYYLALDFFKNKTEIWKYRQLTTNSSDKKILKHMQSSKFVLKLPYLINVNPKTLLQRIKTMLVFS